MKINWNRVITIITFFAFILIPQISPAEDNIRQFAEKYMQAQKNAWENGDFELLETLEDPDVAFHNINGNVTVGLEAHKKYIQEYRKGPGGKAQLHQEWKYLMGEANMFSLSSKWTWTFQDLKMTTDRLMVGRIRNGKLVEEWGATQVPSK